jgi:hypothetical protein
MIRNIDLMLSENLDCENTKCHCFHRCASVAVPNAENRHRAAAICSTAGPMHGIHLARSVSRGNADLPPPIRDDCVTLVILINNKTAFLITYSSSDLPQTAIKSPAAAAAAAAE